MIIGKQPLAGSLLIPALARRSQTAYNLTYNSAQPAARKDVGHVAGFPVDLATDGSHVAVCVIAGQPLPTRAYRLPLSDDLDSALASLGCSRLTAIQRGALSDSSFKQSSAYCAASIAKLELVVRNDTKGWTYTDRLAVPQGYVPADGEVFMLLFVQETFSDLMMERTVFVMPYADAVPLPKGSEISIDGDLGLSYQAIVTGVEELRSMAFKGAN